MTTREHMPDGWVETTLGENITEIAMGPFGSNLKVDMFTETWVPIIKGGNLFGLYVSGDFTFVSEEKAISLWRSVAYPWDFVITHRGTLGQVSVVPNTPYPRYVTSQSQLRFRVDDGKIYIVYLLYFLKSPLGQYELLKNASQVGVPAIATPTKAIKDIRLTLPPLPEQRTIARLLGSLDDKIELLRSENDTLERIAQAVYHERVGRYSVRDALPEGWRVGRLSDEFEIIMGQSPDGTSYNEDGIGMVFFQWRTDFQERFPKTRLFTTEPKRIARQLDVLVSVRAPVGDINVASEMCCIGRGLAAVRSKNTSYVLYKIKSLKENFDKFESEGTIFGSINKDSFANIKVIIPDEDVIRQFESITNPIDEKIYWNYTQIQTLSRLRDEILPRVMRGEVRVDSF